MKYVVWSLVLALLVAHQDNWFWEDSRLVMGIIPVGLFYHACISVAAGCVWFMAIYACWPSEVDSVEAEQAEGDPQ